VQSRSAGIFRPKGRPIHPLPDNTGNTEMPPRA
jgi:hypothetical protein